MELAHDPVSVLCSNQIDARLTHSDHLHLIPRSSPTFPVDTLPEPIELNSLGYAGMMLVRSKDEEKALLDALDGQGGLMSVLEKCGVPREWGVQAIEALTAHLGHSEGLDALS